VRLDGFDTQDFNQLKTEFQRYFNIQLDHKEHSLRGWNWGDLDLTKNELTFEVQGKPAFEIPYDMITNSNQSGKNEVAVDMTMEQKNDTAGDEIVEMRFYIPGTIEGEGEEEEKTKASAFYEQLKEKADIGHYSGDAIASFTDILFLTPRGRFDIDFYPNSLRLRGKTYDHKIQYSAIERIFSLPKPDDIHHLMVIQVNPPLRQGQTPYGFLVLQIVKDEELELDINVDDEEFKQKYEGKLKKRYDQQTHLVLSHVLRGLTERRIQIPGSFTSNVGQAGLPCSLKVNEGYLYLLEKCFLFLPKPTVYIPYSDVDEVIISRVGDLHVHRTFDLEVHLRSGVSHKFSNIVKDEAAGVSLFLKQKNVRVKNEEEEQNNRIKQALADDSDSDVNMGSADEDESPDEDFNDDESDDDDDVAEEFDSDADMSEEEEPPVKKAKV
jgi:structure-specific recognition protein 1